MRGFLQIILHHIDKEVMHGMEDEALLTMLAECIKQVKASKLEKKNRIVDFVSLAFFYPVALVVGNLMSSFNH